MGEAQLMRPAPLSGWKRGKNTLTYKRQDSQVTELVEFLLFLEILPAGKGQMRTKPFLPLYEQPPEPMISKDAQLPGQPSLIRLATTSTKGPLLPGLPPHCPSYLMEPPSPNLFSRCPEYATP